jgi:hypothetical protein
LTTIVSISVSLRSTTFNRAAKRIGMPFLFHHGMHGSDTLLHVEVVHAIRPQLRHGLPAPSPSFIGTVSSVNLAFRATGATRDRARTIAFR